MWHLGTWFSGGLGSVRFMVGLDDLKGLFQSKWFYDSKGLGTRIAASARGFLPRIQPELVHDYETVLLSNSVSVIEEH